MNLGDLIPASGRAEAFVFQFTVKKILHVRVSHTYEYLTTINISHISKSHTCEYHTQMISHTFENLTPMQILHL